jgi:hypothetical protein
MVMAKVLGIHLLRLREGVDQDEFERFVAVWLADPDIRRFADVAGWKPYVLKGDRGDRAGGYAWLWEIDSLEALHRFSPTPETESEEGRQFMNAHPETAAKFRRFMEEFAAYSPCNLTENTTFTDYVVVAG